MNTQLEEELKRLIVSALQLDDIKPEDIHSDEPLFAKGLGLDSIDALELAGALERAYSVKITQESPDVQQAFTSVRALAAFVDAQRARASTPKAES